MSPFPRLQRRSPQVHRRVLVGLICNCQPRGARCILRHAMNYREPLPDGCPPPESDEVAGPLVVFRLVRSSPPSLDDFRSQRAERPSAAFRGVSECVARGLSVYKRVTDCDKTRKLPQFQGSFICQVYLEAGAGRIQQTGRPTHYTWWPLAAFEILGHCEAVAP